MRAFVATVLLGISAFFTFIFWGPDELVEDLQCDTKIVSRLTDPSGEFDIVEARYSCFLRDTVWFYELAISDFDPVLDQHGSKTFLAYYGERGDTFVEWSGVTPVTNVPIVAVDVENPVGLMKAVRVKEQITLANYVFSIKYTGGSR